MLSKLLDLLCPLRVAYRDSTKAVKQTAETLKVMSIKLQHQEDLASNTKTIFTDEVSKLAVTSHAIHRYRERHKGKGSDDEISRMLFKLLIKQLYTMDILPDGKYSLKKGLVGVIKGNTLVTVLPTQPVGMPKLK